VSHNTQTILFSNLLISTPLSAESDGKTCMLCESHNGVQYDLHIAPGENHAMHRFKSTVSNMEIGMLWAQWWTSLRAWFSTGAKRAKRSRASGVGSIPRLGACGGQPRDGSSRAPLSRHRRLNGWANLPKTLLEIWFIQKYHSRFRSGWAICYVFFSLLLCAVSLVSCQRIGLFLFKLIKHCIAIIPHAAIHVNSRNSSSWCIVMNEKISCEKRLADACANAGTQILLDRK